MEFTVGGEGSLSPQHWRGVPRCVCGEGDEQKLRVTACGLVARAVEAAEGVGTVERGGQRVTDSWRSPAPAETRTTEPSRLLCSLLRNWHTTQPGLVTHSLPAAPEPIPHLKPIQCSFP